MKPIKGLRKKSMDRYNVELLPAAYSDLDEIFDYIMVDNPSAAAKMLDNIIKWLQRLETYPHSGVPLLDRSLKKFQFRMVIVDPYIAFYRIIDNKVFVYRILHGARDYSHLLKIGKTSCVL
jgi:plasmid stabilization system protein ParE